MAIVVDKEFNLIYPVLCFPSFFLFFLSQALCVVAYFLGASQGYALNLSNSEMLRLVRIQRVKCVCVSVWADFSGVFLCVFVRRGTGMLPLCFMALHKNKWSLSDFSYNSEYAKAPRSLVCFCYTSRGSGFGVFSI